MYDLKIENEQGKYIEFNQGNQYFTVIEISGMDPQSATINTSTMALFDGEKFNSAKVNSRSINIAIVINEEPEKNRIELYKVLKTKQRIKIYFDGDYRNVQIAGWIEGINVDLWAAKQTVNVSVLCPFPYFEEKQLISNDIDNVIPMLSFPFAITEDSPLPLSYIDPTATVNVENVGDISCGMRIEIYARGSIKNPKIFNYITKQFIGVTYEMAASDSIFINTERGKKTIELLRNGETTNIFNCLMKGSQWLQLGSGENIFVYEIEGNQANAMITISHRNLYEGL